MVKKMSESKTFVRDATGLVREIGVVTATIFILSNVVGGGWQIRVFQGAGAVPVKASNYLLGINPMIMAFILTGLASIATVFVFAIMATAMPRAGGGYVYISRTISPSVGFVTAWAEFLGIAISYGLIAVLSIEFAVVFLPTAGATWANELANAWVLTIGGIVLTVLFAALAYFGTSMMGKALHIMFWIPAVITVGIYAFLIIGMLDPSITSTGFESLLQTKTGTAITTEQYIQTAIDAGMNNAEVDYFTGVSGLIPKAYWAWIGYAAISFAAGEVKESNKSLPRAHLAAGFIILGIYVSISFLMGAASTVGSVQGWSLFDSLGFIDWGTKVGTQAQIDAAANVSGFAWMPFIAMMVATGQGMGFLNIVFAIAGVLWLANDLPPFVVTSSRILFAMSFDRSMPEVFAKVDERWHSPTNAITFTALVAFLGVFAEANFFGESGLNIPILAIFMNPGGGVVVTDLLDALFFTTACIAAILLPTRLKDVYERAAWKPQVFGREAVKVIGWVAFILNMYINLFLLGAVGVLNHVTDPPIPFFPPLLPNLSATGPVGFLFGGDLDSLLHSWDFWAPWLLVFWVVLGIVIYFVVKTYYSRRGVDYTTIYASIPPE
jgi:amino acid transporter